MWEIDIFQLQYILTIIYATLLCEIQYIYNTIETNNLKDRVMEYQYLLGIHRENTIRVSDLKFITDHTDNKSREKRLFLCLLLGYLVLCFKTK